MKRNDEERTQSLSAAQRVLRARLGGLACHARHDSAEITRPARAAFLSQFEALVDPQGQLPESERVRRAAIARREYFTRLAFRSSRARQARRSKVPPDQDEREKRQ